MEVRFLDVYGMNMTCCGLGLWRRELLVTIKDEER